MLSLTLSRSAVLGPQSVGDHSTPSCPSLLQPAEKRTAIFPDIFLSPYPGQQCVRVPPGERCVAPASTGTPPPWPH
jgi:hypothetical protein